VITIGNHLWHCTLFALLAAFFALSLRSYNAKLRFWVWFVASAKFLVPFSMLIALGARSAYSPPARQAGNVALSVPVAVQVAQPFGVELAVRPTPEPVSSKHKWPAVAITIWFSGCLGLVVKRWRDWQLLRSAVRTSTGSRIQAEIPVRFSRALLEPAVVGWRHPVLLLPDGIVDRLSEPQLHAVVVHEEFHARRKDNVFASIHMLVELLFWFHPLVWWIGARLIAERERACDEEVLRRGAEPRVYAESILAVCKAYARSPLTAASGITGWTLNRRIEEIMINRNLRKLGMLRTVGLIAAGVSILAVPVFTGIFNSNHLLAQSPVMPRFQSVTVEACKDLPNIRRGYGYGRSGGVMRTGCMPLADDKGLGLIQRAYVRFGDRATVWPAILPIKGKPSWFSSDLYEIIGTAPVDTPQEMMEGPMLRAALEDRFRLRLHKESAEVPVYTLKAQLAGPKLNPFIEGSCLSLPAAYPPPELPTGQRYCMVRAKIQPPGLDAEGASLGDFANLLSRVLDMPVVDRTGIAGRFNIHIEFAPDASTPAYLPGGEIAHRATAPMPETPTMAQALEQLGLHLERGSGTQAQLVIDDVEKPAAQ
jgi:bla regulator protein blaR1